MEEVQNYGLTWFLYLVLAAAFLLLGAYHSRKLTFWLRIPLLALIAAMAFTPASTLQGEAWWSPAAIVMIFEIDQNGFAGFWRAGLGIIVVWILLTITSFIGRWFYRRKISKTEPSTEELTEQEG